MSNPDKPAGRPGVPPPQKNYQVATERGFEAVGKQADEQLIWLGAKRLAGVWQLPVLNDAFDVDVSAGRITTSGGAEVGAGWRILALHYLAITSRPESRPPRTTFADLALARSYASVYQKRVVGRLCATAGRDAEVLARAVDAVGGRIAEGTEGDAAFDFGIFPRISLRLIWHAADDEFPPSATVLLPDNVESYFCSEDIVVLSESLVARLGGRPF